ncbi:type I restriction enzyme M protein [Geoalkalibacter ferrihydriticus]|uniref:site-specific DNA-methyltransferase (adenine-specific) n=2 Tax=Geoalkalibacter ferrihydriticus TaxID=392333 RepID=A0A0C2EFT2_9BACT|nr:class I SAM-dependent DNA methyltransferase [Geoalkalibacter ferrihydriticus]KIH77488.1 restriction endonuclease HindVIIP subunit M [Geoalkalibacter ferrihydriticus DSM 17813]SDM12498.1 type I restriction enzyme M protein [Geoalkalibacter ferrihydriticus]
MSEQKFLQDLEKKLWNAADKLRSTLDAAQYKHAVLGLLFVKYVSDAFDLRRKELLAQFRDKNHDYYLKPADYASNEEYQAEIAAELEIRDYYTEKNVFWVPALGRWENLQNNAKLPPGTKIEIKNGKTETYEMRSIGRLIDDALEAIEKDNPKLKGVLNKQYGRLQIDQAKLGELIDLIATIPFVHASLQSKDILGHVYEYFLGQFALAEGKKGGQFYTPKSIVTLMVEMLQPYTGRVYDPAMGSGGFFVQSEKFIKEHGGKLGNVSIYGQEYNHTTWQLAAMNMVIRGLDFNFGKEPANTFTNDQHPDLRADTIMANPPFNMKEWDTSVKDDDPRWQYGRPPSGNANFAWMQHMLHHLAPNGSMGLLLANGSMSSNTNTEGDIRRALVENDLVECMVALPGQLFTNTQIPACIWLLTRNKKARGDKADRSGKVLFIDARKLGYMKDRVLRDFKPEDIAKIADTFHAWQKGQGYTDEAGFCYATTLAETKKHDFVLTPGRYVGAADELEDGEPFAEKMARLTAQLQEQFAKSAELEEQIKRNLAGLGYEC